MVRKMDRRPRPQLMIVWQRRENLERQFLRIDHGLVRQPVIHRHDQFSFVLKEDGALHQTIVGKRQAAERRIDFARRHRFELVQQRKLNPIDIEIEFAFQLPHKRQGQLEKAATKEPDSQSIRFTEGSFPAVLQCGAKHQHRGLNTEAQLRAKVRQLNASTGSNEEPAAHLMLQGANRFGHGGLRERKSLGRFAEM